MQTIYFNSYKKILEELLEQEKEREKLGLANAFEHAIFEELLKIAKNKELSKSITKKIAQNIKTETDLVGWKTKRSSQKQLSIIIYDILSESQNKKIENKIDSFTLKQFSKLSILLPNFLINGYNNIGSFHFMIKFYLY